MNNNLTRRDEVMNKQLNRIDCWDKSEMSLINFKYADRVSKWDLKLKLINSNK